MVRNGLGNLKVPNHIPNQDLDIKNNNLRKWLGRLGIETSPSQKPQKSEVFSVYVKYVY